MKRNFTWLALMVICYPVMHGQNVGLGTNAPQSKFHLFQNEDSTLPMLRITNLHSQGDATLTFSAGTHHFSMGPDASDGGKFKINNSAFDAGAGNAFTLTKSGKLGLGITAPVARLDVAGMIKSDSIWITSNAGIGRILMSDSTGKGMWQQTNLLNDGFWTTSGNVVAEGNFIGTTNAAPFIARANNEQAIYLSYDATEANTMIGYLAGDSLTNPGRNNTAVGFESGRNLTTGDLNTFVGLQCGRNLKTGSGNTAIGGYSLSYLDGGDLNSFVGSYSGANLVGSYNCGMGYGAGRGFVGSNSNHNISIGHLTHNRLWVAQWNVAIGDSSGLVNWNAVGNTFVGHKAGRGFLTPNSLLDNSTGEYNVFLGYRAGEIYTSASRNVFIGPFTGCDSVSTGSGNILIGDSIQLLSPANNNYLNIGGTLTGNLTQKRIGIGVDLPSKVLHVGGLGPSDGLLLEGGPTTTQVRIFLDNNADDGIEYILQSTGGGTPVGDGKFVIRDARAGVNRFILDSLGRFGFGVESPGADLQVGIAGDGSLAVANAWNVFSDERYKKNIEPITNPVETLLELRGIKHEWVGSAGSTYGFIAQEAEAVLPEIVYTHENGYKSMDYMRLIPLLVESIKAQEKIIVELENRIQKLEKESAK